MHEVIVDSLPILGKTLTSVKKSGDEILFITSDGEQWKMSHDQGCCERVLIEDLVGDLQDLIGSPIVVAEVTTKDKESYGIGMWTFYTIATVRGTVTIRWLGESNGHYGVSVSFTKL